PNSEVQEFGVRPLQRMQTARTILETLPSRGRAIVKRFRAGDQVAYLVTFIFASAIVLICALVFFELYRSSALARQQFGSRFLSAKTWDPVALNFGALPFIYGTLVTSILALILGVPLGIGASIFLAELAPPR